MLEQTAACSWSSGKDSCLALYKALQQDYQVKYLFNFISKEYGRVSFHGTKDNLVHLQSEAIGIPLIQKETTRDNYEEVFLQTLRDIKQKEGVSQIVRGDIYLQDLSDWVKNQCDKAGLELISPIWHEPTEVLLGEFISSGFKAVLTCAQADKLGKEWVGRLIDRDFLDEIKKVPGVDICGEKGEYHSFVFDGPIFGKKINITKTEKVFINGFWFLDIQEYSLKPKEGKK
jgi:diphthine-ammonia ligase